MSSVEAPDLESFRNEWLSEVSGKKQAQQSSQPVASSSASRSRSRDSTPVRSHVVDNTAAEAVDETDALALYEEAVSREASGDMNTAVACYRKAFKLNPSIDKVYHKESLRKAATAKPAARKAEEDLSFHFQRTVQLEGDYSAPLTKSAVTHPSSTQKLLNTLIDSFTANPWIPPGAEEPFLAPGDHSLIPQTDLRPFYLDRLPDELLTHILLQLVLPKKENQYPRIDRLENFALVARKARLLSLSTSLWQRQCKIFYIPPYQLAPGEEAEEICQTRHGGDWRRMWIEQPRIRTDGCFISVVQYLRKGEADNLWHTPSHIVVYYRFLRFLPNGTVIALTTVVPPKEIARSIDLNLRMRGMSVGRWKLEGDLVSCWGLEDQLAERPKYTMEASYRLKSTNRGRWNKLDLLSLCTANNTTNEVLEVELQHNTKSYFSGVRSYEA